MTAPVSLRTLACVVVFLLPNLLLQAEQGPRPPLRPIVEGPDPRELPLPAIIGTSGQLPLAGALEDSAALPELLRLQSGKPVTNREEWSQRRLELRRILSYYATGQMPPAPGKIRTELLYSTLLANDRLRYRLVCLHFGPDESLFLNVGLIEPNDGRPHPFIIVPGGTPPGAKALPLLAKGPGQGKGLNVLLPPADENKAMPQTPAAPRSVDELAQDYSQALGRGYGIALFNNNDCAEDTTLRNADGSWAFRSTRFFPAYPNYDWGVLAAWAWGVSRIADMLVNDPAVDSEHLIVTGVSRTGKSAMIAAAFDDRLMAAPVVSGGGGLGAFRYSGVGRGGREGLGEMMNKYPNWFGPKLRDFWGKTDRLPFDQHWFVALCAPRPFLALEGESDTVSLPNAVKTTLGAASAVYRFLGVPDRLGLNVGAHGHAFTAEDWTALLDFADQHYLQLPASRDFSILGAGAPIPAPLASFDVTHYGAIGDGQTLATVAFQRALDNCAVSGGGEVYVPAGRFLIGSIQLGNRTVLRLAQGAVLVGSSDPKDYPMIDIRWEGRWQTGRRALIHAAHVDQIGIVGPGRIEGNPAMAASQNPRGSVVLEAIQCNGVLWEGFTLTQGGNWATHPTFCSDVSIRDLTIRGDRDGIDIDSCRRVRIERCDIDTGDDCISLKSGRGRDGARLGRPTEDVLITGCVLRGRHWACIGIGSEVSGGVRNVQITNTCFVDSATHAIYIKSRIGRAGVLENIVGEDLEVKGGSFLRINLSSAGNSNTADDPVEGEAGLPLARNLRFSRVHVNCRTLAEVVQIPDARPILGLVLEQIEGTCTKGLQLRNVHQARLDQLKLKGFQGPLLGAEGCTGLGLEGAAPLAADAKR